MRCHNPHKDRSSPSLLGPTEISISLPSHSIYTASSLLLPGSGLFRWARRNSVERAPPPLVPLPFSSAFPPALLAIVNDEPLSYHAAFSRAHPSCSSPFATPLYPSLHVLAHARAYMYTFSPHVLSNHSLCYPSSTFILLAINHDCHTPRFSSRNKEKDFVIVGLS